MNFARRAVVASLTSLLILLLFVLAFDVGVWHNVGNSSGVKKILADSGVYNSLVPNALSQVKQISTNAGNIPLNDPQIQAAANASLTPAQVQTDVNKIIDSTYAWLNGQTTVPNFNISFASTQTTFADKVAAVVQQRASSLPTCTSADSVYTNAYNATCLPPGVTPAQLANQVRDQVASSKGFLNQSSLAASDIKSSGSNQSVFSDSLKQLPPTYRRLKAVPLIVSLLAILTAAGIVLLSSSRRRGLRRVALVGVGVGIFMLVFAYGLNKVATSKVIPNIKIENAVTQKEVRTVVTDLEQAIDKNYWWFGTLYLVLGVGGWVATEFIGQGRVSRKPPTRPARNLDDSATPV